MRVALVYNQKKEDATQHSKSDDSAEPPSIRGNVPHPIDHQSHQHSSLHHPLDLYAEWDTLETIEAVRGALAEVHAVTLIEANEEAYDRLFRLRPDFVFNIAEGIDGVSRESQMPAIFEMLQIPYTGSDPLTLSLCLDKSRAKEILAYHRIPTPKFTVITRFSELSSLSLKIPAIVKPLHEGSSKGIFNSSLVRKPGDLASAVRIVLEEYHQPALIEEYLPGREFTLALLGNDEHLVVLPIVEIKFDSLPAGVNHVYSYEAKWIWDRAEHPLDIFECPARISPSLQTEIESLCRKAFLLLRCRDWCRIDVRLDQEGRPYILELNPLPGILPHPDDNSCFPKAARAAGLSYSQLIQTVLASARRRYGLTSGHATLLPQTEEAL